MLQRSAHSLRTVDVEVGLSQHSGGFQRGYRIAPQVVTELRTHLPCDFDRRERFLPYDGNLADVADVHTAQTHGGANAQPGRVVKVRFDRDSRREQSGSSGHQEQQKSKSNAGNDYRNPNFELRPLQLLLARQMISS